MNAARKHTEAPASLDAEWMTVLQAAEEAGVSRQTIYAWVMAGKLKTTKLGNRTVIARPSLELLARARAAAAAAEAAVLSGATP